MSTNYTLRGLLRDCLKFTHDLQSPAALRARIDAALAEPVSGQAVVPDERAAFEAELDRLGYPWQISWDNETGYACGFGAEYWRIWQARAALNGGAVAGPVLDMTAAVDRMMSAGLNIHPPLKRSECAFLIRAAICDCRQGRDACTCKGGE